MDRQELWDKEKAKRHARWAKMASGVVYRPFAKKIVASLGFPNTEFIIIDLGTGPGILSVELNNFFPQAKIIGIDISRQMLEIARDNAAEVGMSNYETRLGRAEQIPAEASSVDLVVSQFSVHEWDNPRQGFSEIFRVLRHGGSFILRDFNLDWLTPRKQRLLRFFFSMIPKESYEGHVEMFRFTFEEIDALLKEAGFERICCGGKGLVLVVQAFKDA
ncbi:2-methoxy-6-polyprenyl-1,4-benzoquinol methylase [subsurface metagenome]